MNKGRGLCLKAIILSKSASKYLAKQDKKTTDRIIASINGLLKTPMQGDIESIQGEKAKMRLRVGSYRVLFNVKSDIIEVMDIGPRGDVYK